MNALHLGFKSKYRSNFFVGYDISWRKKENLQILDLFKWTYFWVERLCFTSYSRHIFRLNWWSAGLCLPTCDKLAILQDEAILKAPNFVILYCTSAPNKNYTYRPHIQQDSRTNFYFDSSRSLYIYMFSLLFEIKTWVSLLPNPFSYL